MKRVAGIVALVALGAAGGPPAKLELTNAPLQIQAGVCSPMMVVQLQDDGGTAVPAAADLAVGLSGAVELLGAMACADPPITQVQIDAGTSETPFSVLGTVAGRYPVTASAAGLASATQEVEVLPGPPGRISFRNGPYTVTAGECSPHVAFVVQDVNGNVSPPPPPGLTITVTSTSTNVGIFADPACSTPHRSLVISAPDAGGEVYFLGGFRELVGGGPESVFVMVMGPGFGVGQEYLLQPASASLVLQFADGGPNTTGSVAKLHASVTNHGPGSLTAPRLELAWLGLDLESSQYVLPNISPGATVEREVSGIITAVPSPHGGGVFVSGHAVTSGGMQLGPDVFARLNVVPRVADLGSGCGCSAGGLPLAAGLAVLAFRLRGTRRRSAGSS